MTAGLAILAMLLLFMSPVALALRGVGLRRDTVALEPGVVLSY